MNIHNILVILHTCVEGANILKCLPVCYNGFGSRTFDPLNLVHAHLSWSLEIKAATVDFGRQGCYSGSHLTCLPSPFSISQNPAKDQALAALPPVAHSKKKILVYRKRFLGILLVLVCKVLILIA